MPRRYDPDAYSREEELLTKAASNPFSTGNGNGAFYNYDNPLVKQLQDMQKQGKSYNELETYFNANYKAPTTQKYSNINEAYKANGYDPSKIISNSNSTPIATTALRNAITAQPMQTMSATSQTTATTTPQTTAAQTSTNPLVNALRARIQQMVTQRNQQAQTDKNQSEVTKYSNLRSAVEQNANSGDKGGIGRQDLLQVNTAADNRLNTINQAAQNDITSYQNQGLTEEAQIESDALRQAIEDQRYNEQQAYQQQQFDYQKQQDALAQNQYWTNYAAQQQQQQFENQITQQQQAYQQQQQQQAEQDRQKNDFISTIGQYSNNYAAEINNVRNDGDTSNDWQIPILEAQRQQKIAEAQAKFEQQGIITPDLAPILGKPVGTMTPQYEAQLKAAQQEAAAKAAQQEFENALKLAEEQRKQQETKYSTSKPYYAPKSSSTSSSSSSTPWYLK